MEIFKIAYYDADGGGMRDELTRTEYFEGTFTEAEAHVRAQKSPWGFNYRPHAPGDRSNRHGNGVIQRITRDILVTETMIAIHQDNLEKMYKAL